MHLWYKQCSQVKNCGLLTFKGVLKSGIGVPFLFLTQIFAILGQILIIPVIVTELSHFFYGFV